MSSKLQKLAEFLDQLPAARFEYDQWYAGVTFDNALTGLEVKDILKSSCGTQACALGWAVTLWPGDWMVEQGSASAPCLLSGERSFAAAAKFFDITYDEAVKLFSPETDSGGEVYEPTDDPKYVANKIRTFIQEHDDAEGQTE